jgi:hypothetical protein
MFDLFPPMLGGTLREHYLLLFGSAGLFALGVGGTAAWLGAWLGTRRATRRVIEQAHREAQQLAEARHATLERSIEAIAIEVERISEAQRFSARLLTERALAERPAVPAPPALRREPGTVTPH